MKELFESNLEVTNKILKIVSIYEIFSHVIVYLLPQKTDYYKRLINAFSQLSGLLINNQYYDKFKALKKELQQSIAEQNTKQNGFEEVAELFFVRDSKKI